MGELGRRGFTLVETIIALLMSSLVIVLVSTTFLVQNQYYSTQISRSGAHDNARAATELMASEIRSVMEGGITVAGARTLTVRTPIMISVVCNRAGDKADVYTYQGEAALDTGEVAGIASLDESTGEWTYANTTWSSLNENGGNPPRDCEDNGADTVGAIGDFHRLENIASLISVPSEGDILMLFRETTFSIRTSALDTTALALYRTVYGSSPVEFATGMDSDAQFQYRTSAGTYADTVTSADLGDIDVVRIVANASKRAVTGGTADITFGWSVNIALRNLR